MTNLEHTRFVFGRIFKIPAVIEQEQDTISVDSFLMFPAPVIRRTIGGERIIQGWSVTADNGEDIIDLGDGLTFEQALGVVVKEYAKSLYENLLPLETYENYPS